MPVNLRKVVVIGKNSSQSANIVSHLRATATSVAIGIERPHLNVRQPHIDVATLISIPHMSTDPLREVVLQFKSIDLRVLA